MPIVLMRIGLTLIVFCALAITSFAQDDESLLQELITQEESSRGVTFSYDPDLANFFKLKKPATNMSLDQLLSYLQEQLPLTFEKLNEENILVTTRPVLLRFSIRDGEEAVPGVYVKHNDKFLEAISDGEGKMAVTVDWKKDDVLTFQFLGYQDKKLSVLDLLSQGDPELIIQLELGTTLLNEVTIQSYLGQGISADQQNHSIKIKNGDLGILPGDLDKDVLVSLKTLPGIHSVTGRAGELRVRGGTPDQTLVLFNDIPIFHKGYYYGTISPFSTDIIDEINVFRSGYSSNLGGRVGGAVVLKSTDQVPNEFDLGLATNSYFASTYLKTPLVKNKLGVTFSFRGAHPFDAISPKEEAFETLAISASTLTAADGIRLSPIGFGFTDYNGALLYQSDKLGDVKLNLLSINHSVDIDLTEEIARFVEMRENILDNSGYSASWTKKWGGVQTKIFGSNSNYNYDLVTSTRPLMSNEPPRVELTRNSIDNSRFGIAFSNSEQSAKVGFRAGYDFTNTDIQFSILRNNVPVDSMAPVPPNGVNNQANIHSVFGNLLIPPKKRFMLDMGLRYSHYTLNSSNRLEPRIFANYYASDRFTLKYSFGLYSQDITQNIFFDLSDIPNEKSVWFFARSRENEIITSWQTLFGTTYQHNQWILDLDFYYKEVQNMSTSGNRPLPGTMDIRATKIDGNLISWGMDLFMKYQAGSFDFWTTYTLNRTELDFPEIKTEPFPANFDQTHLFNISGSYTTDHFRATLGWSFSSGIPNYLNDPFFPGTGGVGNGQLIRMPSALGPYSRFPSTHQLDASLSYQLVPGNGDFKLTFGVSALNLYDRQNILETALIRFSSLNNQPNNNGFLADRFTIGFAPDFMIKLEF